MVDESGGFGDNMGLQQEHHPQTLSCAGFWQLRVFQCQGCLTSRSAGRDAMGLTPSRARLIGSELCTTSEITLWQPSQVFLQPRAIGMSSRTASP